MLTGTWGSSSLSATLKVMAVKGPLETLPLPPPTTPDASVPSPVCIYRILLALQNRHTGFTSIKRVKVQRSRVGLPLSPGYRKKRSRPSKPCVLRKRIVESMNVFLLASVDSMVVNLQGEHEPGEMAMEPWRRARRASILETSCQHPGMWVWSQQELRTSESREKA